MVDSPALVSLVIPAFNEAEAIPDLIGALSSVQVNRWNDSFEFVVVDDGSRDETWQLLTEWAEHEGRLTLVRLAGNRGATLATRVGQEYASGDVTILLHADLQEGVELIDQYLAQWRAGYPMVMMTPIQGRTYGSRPEAWLARAFYFLYRRTTHLYDHVSPRARVKLMDRTTTRAFVQHASPYIPRTIWALRQNIPFGNVDYRVKRRAKGTSKWTFRRKLGLMLEFLVEGSDFFRHPWKLATAGGSAYAVLRLLSYAFQKHTDVFQVLADISLAACLLGLMAIIGSILRGVHREVYGNPPYIVAEVRRAQSLVRTEQRDLQCVDSGSWK